MEKAQTVIDNMRYGLIPTGPDGKRAVVFGGSNIHILKPEYVDGGKVDQAAAKALICFWTSPEWSLKMAYAGSNPGNLNGFKTKWMKERLENIKFLDVTTSMLPYGVPFPTIPGDARDHEHRRARHASKCSHGRDDGRSGRRRRGPEGKNIMSGGKL